MAKANAFAVEQWMNKYEVTAKYNIAETCAASVSISDLMSCSTSPKPLEVINSTVKLTYGPINGSEALRSNLARLYSLDAPQPFDPDSILITNGAIGANLIAFYALIGAGDHVICHYPTYQQLYEVPASLGAQVSLWRAKEEKAWELDVYELETLIKPNTKMIIINNPQNPTGAIVPKQTLEAITALARKHSLVLLADEVYRPLFHSISPLSPLFPPSVLSLDYHNVVVTGSLSKAYSLAGIRTGWLASRSSVLLEACIRARDYTTISVSQISDQIASIALSSECVHRLLARNIDLAKLNLDLLAEFVEGYREKGMCRWTKPLAGTTAFVQFLRNGKAVNDVALCQSLFDKTGVMVVPGSLCFGDGKDFQGYVRVGFVCETEVLRNGLEMFGNFMRNDYEDVPVIKESGENAFQIE